MESFLDHAIDHFVQLLTNDELRCLLLVCRRMRSSVLRDHFFRRTHVSGVRSEFSTARDLVTAVGVFNPASAQAASAFYPNASTCTIRGPERFATLPYPTYPPADTSVSAYYATRPLVWWEVDVLNHLLNMKKLVELSLIGIAVGPGCESALAQLTNLRRLVMGPLYTNEYTVDLHFLRQLKRLECVELVCLGQAIEVSVGDFAGLPLLHEIKIVTIFGYGFKCIDGDDQRLPQSLTSLHVTHDYSELSVKVPIHLIQSLPRLQSLGIGSHREVWDEWQPRKITDSLTDVVAPHQLSTLLHLNLTDVFFEDISAVVVCTQLLTLKINLRRDVDNVGKAVALRSRVKLRSLGCRFLRVADFIDALPSLATFEIWMQAKTWTPETLAYVAQYEDAWVSGTARIPPTVEVLALRRLRSLSMRVEHWPNSKVDRVTPAWFAFVISECTKLAFLELAICGYRTISHCVHHGDADLSALRRLETLVSASMVFTTTLESLLPLRRLRVLVLVRWPVGLDITPLYVVGFPLLRRLVLDNSIDCVPLKSYAHLNETLPMLIELLHPTLSCLRRQQESCDPRRRGDYACQ